MAKFSLKSPQLKLDNNSRDGKKKHKIRFLRTSSRWRPHVLTSHTLTVLSAEVVTSCFTLGLRTHLSKYVSWALNWCANLKPWRAKRGRGEGALQLLPEGSQFFYSTRPLFFLYVHAIQVMCRPFSRILESMGLDRVLRTIQKHCGLVASSLVRSLGDLKAYTTGTPFGRHIYLK